MMARHRTESEDTAVRLAAALDYEDGGQRLRELAARLGRTGAAVRQHASRLRAAQLAGAAAPSAAWAVTPRRARRVSPPRRIAGWGQGSPCRTGLMRCSWIHCKPLFFNGLRASQWVVLGVRVGFEHLGRPRATAHRYLQDGRDMPEPAPNFSFALYVRTGAAG